METILCRDRLAKWCNGIGVDVGFGGEPIVPSAICVDRPENHIERAKHPNPAPTQLPIDISELRKYIVAGSLDYIFSSHTLEDFNDTYSVLMEWAVLLKIGGYLVLHLPDQKAYEAECARNGSMPNQAHKHKDFGLEYIRKVVSGSMLKEVHSEWPVPNSPYSFDIVLKKCVS